MIRSPRILAVLLLFTAGCASYQTRHGRGAAMANPELVYPVVAVADFDNRSSFQGQWELGDGFADLLVTRLLQTRETVVLERQDLGDVFGELSLQQQQAFRDEGRAALGRLKNVEYILRGTVTDFTVTGDVSGWFGTAKASARAGGSRARVAMVVKVVEVESGEILTSVESAGRANAGFFGAAANYRALNFGGDAYFRTPLGQATEQAMTKAVKRILKSLPKKQWDPRVAAVLDGRVVVNGGENVSLKPGTRFNVMGPAREITDPVTGNVIDRIPGQVVGLIEVEEVGDQSAYARQVDGRAERGDPLQPLQ